MPENAETIPNVPAFVPVYYTTPSPGGGYRICCAGSNEIVKEVKAHERVRWTPRDTGGDLDYVIGVMIANHREITLRRTQCEKQLLLDLG